MTRRPAAITQAEVERAIRAAQATGAAAVEVRNERGGVVVIRLNEPLATPSRLDWPKDAAL